MTGLNIALLDEDKLPSAEDLDEKPKKKVEAVVVKAPKLLGGPSVGHRSGVGVDEIRKHTKIVVRTPSGLRDACVLSINPETSRIYIAFRRGNETGFINLGDVYRLGSLSDKLSSTNLPPRCKQVLSEKYICEGMLVVVLRNGCSLQNARVCMLAERVNVYNNIQVCYNNDNTKEFVSINDIYCAGPLNVD
jgi:hypothetical protein